MMSRMASATRFLAYGQPVFSSACWLRSATRGLAPTLTILPLTAACERRQPGLHRGEAASHLPVVDDDQGVCAGRRSGCRRRQRERAGGDTGARAGVEVHGEVERRAGAVGAVASGDPHVELTGVVPRVDAEVLAGGAIVRRDGEQAAHLGALVGLAVAEDGRAEHRRREHRRREHRRARTPTARTPTARTPTARTPTARTPTARTPTARTPTARTPTARTPTARTPTGRRRHRRTRRSAVSRSSVVVTVLNAWAMSVNRAMS